jgi:hypothetical protein
MTTQPINVIRNFSRSHRGVVHDAAFRHRDMIINDERCRPGSKPMKIKAVVHEAEEGGFWAEVPALPGCATEGEQWTS